MLTRTVGIPLNGSEIDYRVTLLIQKLSVPHRQLTLQELHLLLTLGDSGFLALSESDVAARPCEVVDLVVVELVEDLVLEGHLLLGEPPLFRCSPFSLLC